MTSYSYETELATLQEVIQQKVATMFSDPSNVVKRTLMEKTVTKLCVFFGKQKGKKMLVFNLFFCQVLLKYFVCICLLSVQFHDKSLKSCLYFYYDAYNIHYCLE